MATFDDWMDLFHKWQKDIGLDASQIKGFKFDAYYADPPHAEIECVDFKDQAARLLGASNQPMEYFLEFFVYTCFIDRDGMYRLTMLHDQALRRWRVARVRC